MSARGPEQNPFEACDLDPREGLAGITARLRERILEAPDEASRAAIRAAWEKLTMHPGQRLAAALGAHPESRLPIDAGPPPSPVILAPPSFGEPDADDLALDRSIESALPPERDARDRVLPRPPLESDPHLRGDGDVHR